MFRRPRFRPPPQLAGQSIPPKLKQAQLLMSQGRFDDAAHLFEELARGAQLRKIPHDARLFLSAGHCRLQTGAIEPAMQNFRQGFSILANRENGPGLQRAGLRVTRELVEKGFQSQAESLREEFFGGLTFTQPPSLDAIEEAPAFSRAQLPSSCPACGGNLRSDEVDWIDESTAECTWCGTSVKILGS